nr:MAG TPA: L SHAPED TAIL FIBER PROTEIN [Caudoviricetes sp.]
MTEQTIVHEVALAGYKATSTGGMLDLGTWGSYGIEKLHLTLDAAWQDLTITAFFNVRGEVVAKKVVGKDGYADVPWEATKENTFVGRIVFEGSINGRRRISANLNYKVTNHSEITDSDPVPTDDRWNQFVTENKEYRDGAFEAAERANARAEDAEAASDDAQAAARAAKASETAANASENAAATSEDNARISAGAAAVSEGNAAASADKAKASETAAAESASNAAVSAASAATAASDAQGYMQTASGAATAANASAENAERSKATAASSATAAVGSATAAAGDAKTASAAAAGATDAKAAAVAAQKDAAASKAAAKTSEDAAAKSAADAKTSEDAAAKSAADADSTANSINDSMTQIAANKEAVSQLKEDTTALQKRQNVLVGSETGNPVSCDDAFAAPLCGLNVYGKSTQDGTPSPDSPVPIVSAGDGGTIAVKMTGKNLLYIPDNKATVRGVTITSKNGIISISGTATEDGYVYLPVKQISIHGLALLSSNVSATTVKLVSASWNVLFTQDSANNTQEVITRICFIVKKGTNYDLNGINVQLELGSTATAYSPYHEQLLTLQTPTGLPGIPVTSGGNYTDQTGQQWVCDEVDLGRGVKVQRVNAVDLSTRVITGTTNLAATKRLAIRLSLKAKDYTVKALCNRLPYLVSFTSDTVHFYVDANSAQVFIPIGAKNPEEGEYILFHALATPIETPLSPAEIAAYKALTAYAPDTVVQASDGAGIKLDYQRDVNLVVKNLEDAIASMTTT